MKLSLTFLAYILLEFGLLGQDISVESAIVSEENDNILSFSTIYNKRSGTGTYSNLEGRFILPNNSKGDSILISHVGFADKIIIISESFPAVVKLTPLPLLIEEISVVADNKYLYDMISRLKPRRSRPIEAKTYFYLESFFQNERVELVEAYYNGVYSDLIVQELKYKKGRIGLRPRDNRFYKSTESSKLFTLYNPYEQSNFFPINPLQLRQKKMMKKYMLSLESSYFEDDDKIYVIRCTPTDLSNDLFECKLWINREENSLIRSEYVSTHTNRHPFLPIGDSKIEGVNISISTEYKSIDGFQYLSTINFDYDVSYVGKMDDTATLSTSSFINAYEYEELFRLPVFKFSNHYHDDYRNVLVVPYDTNFWNNTSEFRFYEKSKDINEFIAFNGVDQYLKGVSNSNRKQHAQLEYPYILWSKERVKMQQPSFSLVNKLDKINAYSSDRYNLDLKLYFDVNVFSEISYYQLYSVLDPVNSFYNFIIENEDLAFINMQFDLLEICRREAIVEIEKLPVEKFEHLDDIYQKYSDKFDELLKLFKKEASRGQNIKSMKKWDEFIYSRLQVSNMEIFYNENK